MRRIAVLTYIPIMLILSIPEMLLAYIVRNSHRQLTRKIAYGFARPYSIGLLRLMGAKIKVTGLDNLDKDQNYVFMSNHTSLLDTPVLMTLIPKPLSFISKREMNRVPLLRHWIILLDCLFLDRSDARAGLRTIRQGADYLKEGYNLAVFPQGTRSRNEEWLPFKAGSTKLSVWSGAPLIPVAIYGTEKVLEKNRFNVKPGEIHVHIFEPIKTAELSKQEQKMLPEQVEAMIHEKYKTFAALDKTQ